MTKALASLLLLALLPACQRSSEPAAPSPSAPSAQAPAVNSAPATKITKGVVAAIDYTLTDDKGEVLDTSKGRQPLSFLQGYGNIVPGLEKALEGKAKGDTFKVTIPPEEGYGNRSDEHIKTLPKAQFQGPAEITTGMQFRSRSGPVTVTKVEGDTITIDGNHPLAGKALTFEVTIKDLRNATAEELAHGHQHDGGAH